MCPDARLLVAMLLNAYQAKKFSLSSVFAYGTRSRVHLFIGKQARLRINSMPSHDYFWLQVERFISQHRHDYIGGFIGFDPSAALSKGQSQAESRGGYICDLFVPEYVLECFDSGAHVVKGCIDVPHFSADLIQSLPGSCEKIDIAKIDDVRGHAAYLESVDAILRSIAAGDIVRATLARKMISTKPLSLIRTFLSDYSLHRLARSFLFASNVVSFAGQCPELLAEGTPDQFSAHKLSGTYPITCAGECVADMAAAFKADERIVREHRSGTSSIEAALRAIACVQREEFQVMQLPSLLHGWAEFRCRLNDGNDVCKILRAVFPHTAFPVETGVRLIADHEGFSRGPYYGMIGLVAPCGEFSFTQILRSVFRNKSSHYLIAGAAITVDSTPEIELLETISKLKSIHAFGVTPSSRLID